MALDYRGDWTLNLQYYIDDYVTDVNDESGEGAGVLLYCIVDNISSSSDLTNDWAAGFWSTRSGTNSFYNNSDTDGGPRLVEGTLATATSVENKFTAVARGFDEVSVSTGSPLSLSAIDYSVGGRDLALAAAERANKVLSFDASGDVTVASLKGSYRGDWATATFYLAGDTVTDVNNVFGGGVSSTLVALVDHTSTGVGDVAKWNVVIDTQQLQDYVDAAEVQADASAASAVTSASEASDSAASAVASDSSADAAELSGWDAEAEALTADSYATEAEDVFVKTYVSDGDGTFTATNTTDYSAFHWSEKAEAAIAGGVATVVGGTNVTVDSADANNPIVNVPFTPFDSRYSAIATFDNNDTLGGAQVYNEIDVVDGQVTGMSYRSISPANIGAVATTGGTMSNTLSSSVDFSFLGYSRGSRSQYGVLTTGASATIGSKDRDSLNASDYSLIMAYDCYWDAPNLEWAAIRSTLGRKWLLKMGYHEASFSINLHEAVATTWDDTDWDRLFEVDTDGQASISATAPTDADHLTRKDYVDGTYSKAESGYQKLPSGIILQWGTATSSTGGDISATFPTAFPTFPYSIQAMVNAGSAFTVTQYNTSTTGCIFTVSNASGTGASGEDIKWFAIGY